ncbi:MAG: Rossmann-like and DUF2520 domain-containing protein [Flavobacteriales bacterium]|jgi:predicted short-subunit dehydrogenase-like oxidoreductase (DUF2520 family)
MSKLRVAIIGTGNVAWHFCRIFQLEGHTITGIFSRNAENARLFAYENNTAVIKDLENIPSDVDLAVLAVSDEAISEVSAKIKTDALVIHTSGTTSLNALSNERSGVVWAIHSMRKGIPSSYKQTPFIIETKNEKDREIIYRAFDSHQKNIFYADSEQRLRIHLAAVIANNFVNHLFSISEKLVNDSGITFDILKPMIDAHVEGIHNTSPLHLQTGPAIRNDQTTINQHLELLHSQPELMNLYRMLTDSIQKLHHKK